MPATSSPTSSPTSSDPAAKSSADPLAPDAAPAPDTAATAAPAPSVGEVLRNPAGALVLVVAVTPADGDTGAMYETVELPGHAVRYFADDLADPAAEPPQSAA